MRNLAFLISLRWLVNESVSIQALRFCHAQVVCQHPVRKLDAQEEYRMSYFWIEARANMIKKVRRPHVICENGGYT